MSSLITTIVAVFREKVPSKEDVNADKSKGKDKEKNKGKWKEKSKGKDKDKDNQNDKVKCKRKHKRKEIDMLKDNQEILPFWKKKKKKPICFDLEY